MMQEVAGSVAAVTLVSSGPMSSQRTMVSVTDVAPYRTSSTSQRSMSPATTSCRNAIFEMATGCTGPLARPAATDPATSCIIDRSQLGPALRGTVMRPPSGSPEGVRSFAGSAIAAALRVNGLIGASSG
mgnify:CR=1 FL=1